MKLKSIGLLLLAATALSGCATQPVEPPPKILPVPTCSSKEQCDAMWTKAIEEVQKLSGMKAQIATDSFVQTFNGTGSRLTGSAKRVPQPDGTTAIEANFSCRFTCGNLPYSALNLFIVNVNSAGAGFKNSKPDDRDSSAVAAPPMTKEAYQKAQIQKLTDLNLPYAEYQKRYKQIMSE